MQFETIFLGNEPAYLEILNKYSTLTWVVCEPLRGNQKKAFGSAYQFAKENRIKTVSPLDFFKKLHKTDIIVSAGFANHIPTKVLK